MFVVDYIRNNWAAPQGYREVLRVGLPLMAGMVSSTVMQFTDRLFLSHYSLDAIAAAMPATIASMTLHMTMLGLCGYAGVLAAQHVGARSPHRVGPAIWQGVWCALFCTIILGLACLLAEPLFELVGHAPEIRALEIDYFVIITAGASMALLGAAISGFFFGRGVTQPVMVANIVAAIVNVPLDYAFIFGAWGFPELGVIGAGLATCIGWFSTLVILSLLVFTKKNDKIFCVRSGWRLDRDLFGRLIRYGLPSGVNMFVEFAAFSGFLFLMGGLGKVALAASNIALSINSLTFMPMLGLNMATAAMVGQAMGRRKPDEAARATYHALHLAFLYMVAGAVLVVVFAGPLMDFFHSAGDVADDNFAPVRATGVVLLYYVAGYSLVDAANLVFIGALKGAGDTVAMMKIIVSCVFCTLFLPMTLLWLTGNLGLHKLWLTFTAYIVFLAIFAYRRFRGGRWRSIRMVDAPLADEDKDTATA